MSNSCGLKNLLVSSGQELGMQQGCSAFIVLYLLCVALPGIEKQDLPLGYGHHRTVWSCTFQAYWSWPQTVQAADCLTPCLSHSLRLLWCRTGCWYAQNRDCQPGSCSLFGFLCCWSICCHSVASQYISYEFLEVKSVFRFWDWSV